VGQRRGLDVAFGEPRYVSRIDPLTNTIQLGRREDLETREFTLERGSFIDPTAPHAPFRAQVRIRHRAEPIPATVAPLGERRYSVTTDAPVWAAAPGQAAVLYDGEEVLGGGRIERPARREATAVADVADPARALVSA
ncbi:MAG: aminomethyltransferase beta-barrel domain-containing protein, partial [Candidatus Limnocylindrales bacterium]